MDFNNFQKNILKSIIIDIYYNKLDKWVQKKVLKDSKINQRNQKYKKLVYQIDKIKEQIKKLNKNSQEYNILLQALEILKNEKIKIMKLKMKDIKIKFFHFTSSWIGIISGNKVLATKTKSEINYFVEIKLIQIIPFLKRRVINLVTNKINFLGYKIFFSTNLKINLGNNNIMYNYTHQIKPILKLNIPINFILKIIEEKGYSKKLINSYYSICKLNYTTLEDIVIIKHFIKFWLGLVNYYSGCDNMLILQYIHYILNLSCALTLSHRHQLNIKKIFSDYKNILI